LPLFFGAPHSLVRVRGFVAAISAEAANNPMIGRPFYELVDFQPMRTQ
jgi:hypothetical protein